MLSGIKELEEKYSVGIEEDSGCIFLYSNEFNDYDMKKFHTAIIELENNKISLEYNHYSNIFVEKIMFSGAVICNTDLKDFVSKDICLLCNHWSLFSPREQWRIEKFTYEVVDFIKEVLTNEEV